MSANDPKRTSGRCSFGMPGVPAGRRLNGNGAAYRIMQQRLDGLKLRGIEALGQPTVCVGEHLARFVAPILLLAKARQTCRRSELPSFAKLVPRRSDRSTEVFSGLPIL